MVLVYMMIRETRFIYFYMKALEGPLIHPNIILSCGFKNVVCFIVVVFVYKCFVDILQSVRNTQYQSETLPLPFLPPVIIVSPDIR